MSQSASVRAPGGALGRWQALVRITARVVLGAVMLWAGLLKLADPRAFAMVVERYDVLPEALVAPWAAVLPAVEVVASGCLLVGVWMRGAALVTLGLLGSFGVALGVNVVRGADMTCGCFGLDGVGHSLPVALGLDVVLGVMAAWVMIRTAHNGRWPRCRHGT